MEQRKLKRCARCGIERPVAQFCKDRTRKDGLSCYCRDCVAELTQRRLLRRRISTLARNDGGLCARCGAETSGRVSVLGVTVPLCADCVDVAESERPEDFVEWVRQKTCVKCGHVWLSRTPQPVACPACRNTNWSDADGI